VTNTERRKRPPGESALGGEPVLVHNDSFLDYRRCQFGAAGPEAYYSRSDFSNTMSRSIGDRFGPRGCVALLM
jgi:hypothetical protein